MNDHEISIVSKLYDLYIQVYKKSLQFPKNIRYTIGVRAENALLDCHYQLLLALRMPKNSKELSLLKAGASLDSFTIYIRLLHEIGSLELKHYLKLQEKADEINRMLGGWIKYVRNKN